MPRLSVNRDLFSALWAQDKIKPPLQCENSKTVAFNFLPILILFIRSIFRISIHDIDLAMNYNTSTLPITVIFSLPMSFSESFYFMECLGNFTKPKENSPALTRVSGCS